MKYRGYILSNYTHAKMVTSNTKEFKEMYQPLHGKEGAKYRKLVFVGIGDDNLGFWVPPRIKEKFIDYMVVMGLRYNPTKPEEPEKIMDEIVFGQLVYKFNNHDLE